MQRRSRLKAQHRGRWPPPACAGGVGGGRRPAEGSAGAPSVASRGVGNLHNPDWIAIADLDHAWLPKVSDHFSDPPNGQFLVMEYIPGADLATLLKQQGAPFPVAQGLLWADQLLAYLHNRTPPVLHRELNWVLRGGTDKQGLNLGDQLAKVNRLGLKVVAANVQGPLPVALQGIGGEGDNGNPRRLLPHA